MDDFIDSFLQAPSWPDVNTSGKSFGGEEKTPPLCMIPTSMENIAADDLNLYVHDGSSSIFIGSDLRYGNGIDRSLFSRDKLSLHEIRDHTSHGSEHRNSIHDGNFSLQGMIQSNSTAASFGHDFNTPCSSVTVRHNTLTKSSSIESNGSEPSAFQPSLGDSHSITSVPAMWPRSYSDVTLVGEGKLQGFGFQGVEGDTDIMRQTTLGNGKYTNLNDFPATSLHDHSELHNPHLQNFSVGQQKLTNGLFQRHQQEQNDLLNIHMPFFVAGSQMTPSKAPGNQYHQQFPKPTEGNSIKHQINNSYGNQSQTIPANGSACNGAAKPRVRARRGQATDPHSIAERLRREKISERMKSLLELVPNSNKADKASMLDEIIDYVKFLQLQVKVLSMSRLGAAGAVAPLITDVQAEASGSFFLPSLGHRASDPLDSQENSAFEQEVVKLMESSITTAMQYLQTKGLCLMPIALASAISHQEGSTAAIPHERRISREDGPNDCNGALIKHEAVQNSSETSGI